MYIETVFKFCQTNGTLHHYFYHKILEEQKILCPPLSKVGGTYPPRPLKLGPGLGVVFTSDQVRTTRSIHILVQINRITRALPFRGLKTGTLKHYKAVICYICLCSNPHLWSLILCNDWECYLKYKWQRWDFANCLRRSISRQNAQLWNS